MLKGCFVSEKIFPQSRGLFNKKALTLFKSFKYGTNEAQVDKPCHAHYSINHALKSIPN